MSLSSNEPKNHNDEIDLIDVAKTLWNHKWILIISTTVCALVGLAASFIITPKYQLKATIKPPLIGQLTTVDFSNLPVQNDSLHSFNVGEAFDIFYGNLASNRLKQHYFEQYYWPAQAKNPGKPIQKRKAYQQLQQKLSIKKDNKSGVIDISLNGTHRKQLVTQLHTLLQMADQESKKEINQTIASQIKRINQNLLSQIEMKRTLAKHNNQDRLVQLKEAMHVARASDSNRSSNIVPNQTSGNTISLNEYTAMYLRGVKALQAEVDNLQNRRSNDAFIPDFRELNAKLDFYKNFTVNIEDVVLFRVDGDIQAPEIPVSPNRTLLLLMALFLGALVGCFLVFIRVQLHN